MNSLFTVVLLLSTLMLVSCNGGGGSSGEDSGSNSVSGSAVMYNLNKESNVSQCVSGFRPMKPIMTPLYNDQVTCQNIGGNWTTTTSNDSCRFRDIEFSCGTGSCALNEDIARCEEVGGTFIPSSTVYYCNTSGGGVTLPNCEDLGGVTMSFHVISGDIMNNHLRAGTNNINFNNVFPDDFDNVNESNADYPIAVRLELSIPSSQWESMAIKETGDRFFSVLARDTNGDESLTPAFSAVLPTSPGLRVDKMYLVYKPMY